MNVIMKDVVISCSNMMVPAGERCMPMQRWGGTRGGGGRRRVGRPKLGSRVGREAQLDQAVLSNQSWLHVHDSSKRTLVAIERHRAARRRTRASF